MAVYADIEVVIPKLRIGDLSDDDPIRDELETYGTEIDGMFNRELISHIGYRNSAGNEITIPLNENTEPPLDTDLKEIANNLLIGKFRMETGNGDKLWVEAQAAFKELLLQKFGWARDTPFKVRTTITPDIFSGAVGATVTLAGRNFLRFSNISVYFNGVQMATTPTSPITDVNGQFTGVTFDIPAGTPVGGYEIKVLDSKIDSKSRFSPNAATERFQVTL